MTNWDSQAYSSGILKVPPSNLSMGLHKLIDPFPLPGHFEAHQFSSSQPPEKEASKSDNLTKL